VISILRCGTNSVPAFSARDDEVGILGGHHARAVRNYLGVALTVSVAFIWTLGRQVGTTPARAPRSQSTPDGHWDVVGNNMRVAQERAREAWMKLPIKLRADDKGRCALESKTGPIAGRFHSSFDYRLALAIKWFFRHPLERLAGALDPILMFIASGGKSFTILNEPLAPKRPNGRRVANVLTDRIFVNF